MLTSLALLPRVVVGIISGRTLADLKSKICLSELTYAGTCGLEMELQDYIVQHPEAVRFAPVIAAAAEVINSVIKDYTGVWIEHKALALTVHYRQVRHDEVVFLKQCLDNKLARFDGVLISVEGSMATEILPDVGWGKGEALEAILKHDGRKATPLYAGNDANDASALQATVARGGVAIGVGPFAPLQARHHVPNAECLAEHLRELLAMLDKSLCHES